MSLEAQQRALQAAIREGGEAPVDSALGLDVYRHAYAARLAAALRDNYLVLHRALGDEDFDALALAYLRAQPSRHASIRWFGHRLAEFMAEDDYAGPLVDIARMDWALRGAFDGPEAEALAADTLRALAPQDWPGCVFKLHPSAQLLTMSWAVEPAWRALRAWEPESDEPAPELPEPQDSTHTLLVWRQDLETRWRSLEALEAKCLQAVSERQDFAAICALAGSPDAVVEMLQRWLADGLLAA